MPKVSGTKKRRAQELLERLEHGPEFRSISGALSDLSAAAEAQESYRRWVKTWVVNELRDLVPELRGQAKNNQVQA